MNDDDEHAEAELLASKRTMSDESAEYGDEGIMMMTVIKMLKQSCLEVKFTFIIKNDELVFRMSILNT